MSEFLDLSKFTKKKGIGEGGFGHVFKIIEKSTKKEYAAKIMRNLLSDDESKIIIYLKREINILSQLVHPCVVKFIGYSPVDFEKNLHPVLVTEFYPNGSLRGIIGLERSSQILPKWNDTKKLINIYGIASAMMFLHQHNVLHRDLKPDNILEDEYLFPKITDFGLSKIVHQNEDSITSLSDSGLLGTPAYIAPEIWDDDLYTKACDVYAFAFIVYEIMTLKKPFAGLKAYRIMKKVLEECERPNFTVAIPPCYKKLIIKCWSQRIEDRPTFAEIVEELKTNKKFITSKVNAEEYHDYIKLIESQGKSFDPKTRFAKITVQEKEFKEEEEENENETEEKAKDDAMNNVNIWKKFGSIVIITSELYPFSNQSDASIMIWENAKQLAKMGLDIHCISPYYNENNQGETDYLKKYGIEFIKTISIRMPEEKQLGIHYGIVEGVKCWFMHSYDFFGIPLQSNGSGLYKVSFLVALAKGSLELICQFFKKMPRLIVSNDWQTGFVPSFGRKHFGSVFDSTFFMHVIHNLEKGYNGKIFIKKKSFFDFFIKKNISDFEHIVGIYNDFYYDSFDDSIDPSRCALKFCDQWSTVSKKYRDDLLESSPYSYLLKEFQRPFACQTGIDIENQQLKIRKLKKNHDQAKKKVQSKLFGFNDDKKCLFVFIGSICEQKGVNLIVDSFEELNRNLGESIQFLVVGKSNSKDDPYEVACSEKLINLKNKYKNNFCHVPSVDLNEDLLIYAADFVLMPSLFEPAGFIQQKAFVSGSPLIAFKTGGLSDTVFEFDKNKKTGNGLLFWCHKNKDFCMAIERAYDLFKDKALYKVLRKNASESALSTEETAALWLNEFTRMFFTSKK